MADTDSPTPENETPNQRKARERREKRNAKMAATGEERLAKIKQLNGGVAPPDEVLGGPTVAPPAPSSKPANTATVHDDDPEEVDISDHAYTPASRSGAGTPGVQPGSMPAGRQAAMGTDPLRDAMLQMQMQQSQQQGQNQTPAQGQEDPLMKMMQSLMGSMPGQEGGGGGSEAMQNDPMFKMMQTMMGGGGGAFGGGPQQPAPTDSRAYLWRIVHAIFAISFATFVAATGAFSGSQMARNGYASSESEVMQHAGRNFFLIFATAELVLQSGRFFLEKGQLQGSGWLATIANSGFVPEPYASYVRTVGRYSTIYTTVVADAMVVIFVLGVMAWWRGVDIS